MNVVLRRRQQAISFSDARGTTHNASSWPSRSRIYCRRTATFLKGFCSALTSSNGIALYTRSWPGLWPHSSVAQIDSNGLKPNPPDLYNYTRQHRRRRTAASFRHPPGRFFTFCSCRLPLFLYLLFFLSLSFPVGPLVLFLCKTCALYSQPIVCNPWRHIVCTARSSHTDHSQLTVRTTREHTTPLVSSLMLRCLRSSSELLDERRCFQGTEKTT